VLHIDSRDKLAAASTPAITYSPEGVPWTYCARNSFGVISPAAISDHPGRPHGLRLAIHPAGHSAAAQASAAAGAGPSRVGADPDTSRPSRRSAEPVSSVGGGVAIPVDFANRRRAG
jgi:hypothetical protein